jgi:hypothetical protein
MLKQSAVAAADVEYASARRHHARNGGKVRP